MRYLGTVSITIDGTSLDNLPGASLDVGGFRRKEVITDRGIGYAETRAPATIEVEVGVSALTDTALLGAATDVTAVFQADTGQAWVLREAWVSEPPKMTAGENSKMTIKLMAGTAEAL